MAHPKDFKNHPTGKTSDGDDDEWYPTPPQRKRFKPATHLIFDLDGVLLDTEKIYDECFAAVVAKEGKKLTDEVLAKTKGTQPADCFRVIIEGLGLKISKEEFEKEFEKMAYEKCSKAKLMPGADRIARHLYYHKVPMAVATSNESRWYKLLTQKHKHFFDLMHHVVTSVDDPEVKKGKPAPDIFLVCASRFKEKPHPSKCLVIEDSSNGLKGALAAGMQVAMMPDKLTPPEQQKGATQILKTLYRFHPEQYGWPEFIDDPPDGESTTSVEDEDEWPPV